MQIKHSAIREYSDHLITFQSGFPHVSHQSLQDRGRGSAVKEGENPKSQEPWHKPTGLLQDPVLDSPAQGSVFSSVKGGNEPWPKGRWCGV